MNIQLKLLFTEKMTKSQYYFPWRKKPGSENLLENEVICHCANASANDGLGVARWA